MSVVGGPSSEGMHRMRVGQAGSNCGQAGLEERVLDPGDAKGVTNAVEYYQQASMGQQEGQIVIESKSQIRDDNLKNARASS